MRLGIPSAPRPYVLTDVAVPRTLLRDFAARPMRGGMTDGLVRTDLGVAAGRLCRAAEIADAPRVPAGGFSVLPRLVEAHVHLDKFDTIAETGRGDGTLMGAIGTLGPAMRAWDVAHFRTRMTRAVEGALAAGVGTLRTHVDCMSPPEEQAGWHAIQDVMADAGGRMTIAPVALAAIDRATAGDFDARCRQVARAGGVLGAFLPPEGPDPAVLDAFLDGAGRYGLDVDFHVDEHLREVPSGTVAVSEAVIRTGYEGRVLAGHACRLGLLPSDDLDRAADVIARSGVTIATLPRTNLYLQDRGAVRTPRRRGMAPVRELSARGVPIVIGTDNVRDAFFPFGDHDLLSVFAEAVHGLHLDDDLGHWIRSITEIPGSVLGGTGGGLAIGAPADLLLVPGQDWTALLSSRPQDRTVLIGGRDIGAAGSDVIQPKEVAL